MLKHNTPKTVVFLRTVSACLWSGGTIGFLRCSSPLHNLSTSQIISECATSALLGSLLGAAFGLVVSVLLLAVVRHYGDLSAVPIHAKQHIHLVEVIPAAVTGVLVVAVLPLNNLSPLLFLSILLPSLLLYGMVERWYKHQ